MLYNMNLSKNFTLDELTNSATAKAKDFKEQFNPSFGIVKNLEKLAINILQPLRDLWDNPISVNCAYRCARLNQAVGGVASSQHLQGKAADITAGDIATNTKLFKLLEDLPYDQRIFEQGGKWIHVSYDETRNRKQTLFL